jgi:hypothetical protein
MVPYVTMKDYILVITTGIFFVCILIVLSRSLDINVAHLRITGTKLVLFATESQYILTMHGG